MRKCHVPQLSLCAGDEEMAQTIIENDEDWARDDDDDGRALVTDRVPSTSIATTIVDDGPSPTSTSTH